MSRLFNQYTIAAVFLFIFANKVQSQAGLCPANLDFEAGDFSGWECRYGYVDAPGGVNTVHLDNIGQVGGRHTIISTANAGIDPYGRFPTLCPNGSGYSVKLGSGAGGHEAESISYTYAIPSTLTTFSMLFQYAIVLQDPNHQTWEQPRFRARISDLTDGAPIPCVDFDFTASGSLPGFLLSPIAGDVLYKSWTPITINLTAFIGKTIKLEFITNDCIFQAHFGYAYVDVNTNCNGAISGSTICQGDNQITLSAPSGFQTYKWFSDNTFATVLATTQNLLLDPAPAVGTVFPVIVEPYPGFGCKDTLYATISVAAKPVSIAGPDVSMCNGEQLQLGGPATAGYSYQWTPQASVTSHIISNPFVRIIPESPTEFIIKTTDILTGCYSQDTAIISSGIVDDDITVEGLSDFCPGQPAPTLTVNSASTSIQWYNGPNSPIPGATLPVYQPTVAGAYWAQVIQHGCTDSTEVIPVAGHPKPLVSFTPDDDSVCITNNAFVFHHTATVADNSAMSFNWKFSDGTVMPMETPTKSFANPGDYKVELVVTSEFGCKDSTTRDVYVFANNKPNFNWDSICTSRPVSFKNLSDETGSVSASYNWNFNNGGPNSTIRNPLPVVYSIAGITDVTLTMISYGCEASPMDTTRKVFVNAAAPGIHYRDITVPEGSSEFLHARDLLGNNYNWRPRSQLSNYHSRYTQFFTTGGSDIRYYVDITDKHTCVTTDTIFMQILKKPGYYIPTAFTPNGDGLNDLVIPYLVGMKSLKSFSIYDRWGHLIFYSTTYGEGWNGKYKGIDQDTGVYIWTLEYFDNNNKKQHAKGTVTIIR